MLNLNIENIQAIGTLFDYIGVTVMLVGILISTFIVIKHFHMRWRGAKIYDNYRKDLARSILLGLEFIVAGDIIRTISSGVNLTSILALAGIVLIRSFLAAEFELEVTGHWPWQRSIKRTKHKSNTKTKRSKKAKSKTTRNKK